MHPGQDWTHAVFCKQVDLQNKCKAMRRTFTRCDVPQVNLSFWVAQPATRRSLYAMWALCFFTRGTLEQGMIEKKTAFRLIIIRKWWIIR